MLDGSRMRNIQKSIKAFFNTNNRFDIYAVLLLGISLLPLLIVGRYNVLMADDYAIGKVCHKLWMENGSIISMLQYAFKYTINLYCTWRGSFTVNFFDTLNPGFLGENLACITPFIMLSSVLFSMYFFIKAILSQFYIYTKREVLLIFSIVSFLIIQTMPSPVEGLYWFAGAMSYTMLHYMMLLFFCLLIYTGNIQPKWKQNILGLFVTVYAFLVGGSQYITALICVLGYIVFVLLNFRRLNWWKITSGLSLLCGFLLNLFAPGNAVRQQESNGMGAVGAIFRSFYEAAGYAKTWITPILIVGILFLLPVIWKLAESPQKEYTYKHPLIMLLGSYCFFAAAFTPSLYGVGNVDAGRIQNLIQSIFYIIVLIDVFYLIGWIQYKIQHSDKDIYKDIGTIKNILGKYKTVYQWTAFGLMILVFVGTGDKNTFSSMSALRSMVIGEAQTYYAEAQERLEIYRDESNPVAAVEAFSVKPKVLYFTDIVPEDDINYWINENVAEYYGKEKVVLKDSAE